ncbi:hypothetical protein BpHYR1_008025 [Brachionus plicatilis]|uniref:Uncharacterized protein n=1 Tax=Brachionus plicatilis TaxID=10195 RepID=A0A3M7PU77_BRAPC|nr:hypothetical protein BpHYR1_008025 [Brachionus plicatilis]
MIAKVLSNSTLLTHPPWNQILVLIYNNDSIRISTVRLPRPCLDELLKEIEKKFYLKNKFNLQKTRNQYMLLIVA